MQTLIKATAVATVLAAGVLSAAPFSPAMAADNCKNVVISVKNSTGRAIRVVDLDYRDYGSRIWRSEPTSNRVLASGARWSDKRRLENVNYETTRIRVQYQILKSNGKWKLKKYEKLSRAKRCTKGTRFYVNVG